MNYRIAYERLCHREKLKNFKDGIVDNRTIRSRVSKEMSVHHILPKALGGNSDFNNLVLFDQTTHAYAHILLNLALIQENNIEQFNKLSYSSIGVPIDLLMKKNAIKKLKIAIYLEGKKHKPLVMNLKDASKYFCFMAHKNFNEKANLDKAVCYTLKRAMIESAKYGIKTKILV